MLKDPCSPQRPVSCVGQCGSPAPRKEGRKEGRKDHFAGDQCMETGHHLVSVGEDFAALHALCVTQPMGLHGRGGDERS